MLVDLVDFDGDVGVVWGIVLVLGKVEMVMCSYWIVVGDIISRCGWVIIGLLFIDIEGVVVVCVCYCWWRFDFVCGWLVCCVGWGFVCVWLLFVFDCVVFGVCGGGVCVGEGRCCGIGSCLCVGSCV